MKFIKSKIENPFTIASICLSAFIIIAETITLIFNPPINIGRISWLLLFMMSSVLAAFWVKRKKTFVSALTFYVNIFILVMSLILFGTGLALLRIFL